jgi:hypothetical protein
MVGALDDRARRPFDARRELVMKSTARTTESPLRLLAQAAGSPREMLVKGRRLGTALSGYVNSRTLDRRLALLVERGYVDPARIPTRVQLAIGGLDMLRFWISPAAAQYYADKGIHFGFHQALRILDDPASMVDPIGLLSDRDVIIGHVMQVVHANPSYDLQLLEAHEDGLDELERQVEEMVAGTHPRARSIGAIIEDPDYHQRLLGYVRAYKRERDAAAPVRENVANDPKWAPIERTFGTLRNAMIYFSRMPTTIAGAARHLATVKAFPLELAVGSAATAGSTR